MILLLFFGLVIWFNIKVWKMVFRGRKEKKELLKRIKDPNTTYDEANAYYMSMQNEKYLGMAQRQRYANMLQQKAHGEMLQK